ncbi:hypothetical protein ACFY64_28980 [Streptomyces collinus]|uniref:hypothetical protein n=1 Tax=Streptomyces collinus TaxID=42684 RepID=UPI0036C16946
MMIDVEKVDTGDDFGPAATTAADDQGQDGGEMLLELARARMMTYFALASLPPNLLLRVTPVGRPDTGKTCITRTPCACWSTTPRPMACADGSVDPPLRERSAAMAARTPAWQRPSGDVRGDRRRR